MKTRFPVLEQAVCGAVYGTVTDLGGSGMETMHGIDMEGSGVGLANSDPVCLFSLVCSADRIPASPALQASPFPSALVYGTQLMETEASLLFSEVAMCSQGHGVCFSCLNPPSCRIGFWVPVCPGRK